MSAAFDEASIVPWTGATEEQRSPCARRTIAPRPVARSRPPGEVAGLVVHDRETGRIVHHEMTTAEAVPEAELADRLIRRWEHLVVRYPFPQFDIEYGLFASPRAFLEMFPGCIDA